MVTASTYSENAANEAPPVARRLNRDVFLVEADGVARLLDFDRGRFYALDPVGSRMLALCLEHGADETAARVAAEYDAAPEQVREDLAVLLRDLEGKRLLASARRGPMRAFLLAGLGGLLRGADWLLFRPLRGATPGPRTAGRLLFLAWVSLRLFGWTGTVSLWRRWRRADAAPDAAARARAVETVDRLVREAAARTVCFPAVCKERALAGWQLLRTFYGLPAALVVGVRCHPFGAHAWVECGGAVVTDDPAHCELYAPVARYL
jgi:hypothetical protein